MGPPSNKDAARALLRAMFDAGVGAAMPARVVPDALPEPPAGRTLVIAAGKAAASMSRAVERSWRGALSGFAVTRYGHGVTCERLEVFEAGHPTPDAASQVAGERALREAAALGRDDMLLALISGGASSLLCAPSPGVTLDDKRALTEALVRSGAPITDINTVRRALSAVKGGRLADAARPARVASLIISDVVGDDPADVGSGPTIGRGCEEASSLEILTRWGVTPPERVAKALRRPRASTAAPDARDIVGVVASSETALDAAGAVARAANVGVIVLRGVEDGDAAALAREHAIIAKDLPDYLRPSVILSGGEATVRVTGDGRGGPNQHFALALALALDGAVGVYALACDTDGLDGVGEAAGAIIGPDTLARAAEAGIDVDAALARCDSGGVFAALGDAMITGPTLTNVNDFRAIFLL